MFQIWGAATQNCADHNARSKYVVQSCHRCQHSEAENERERRRSVKSFGRKLAYPGRVSVAINVETIILFWETVTYLDMTGYRFCLK